MNNKGQITLEYILMMGIIIIILLSMIHTIHIETEKNTIITAAQIGAQTGIDKNAYAMYYNNTFNDYAKNNPKLLYPSEIKIINISITQKEDTIFLEASISSNHYLSSNQKEIIGQRINYYIRKTVYETFNTENTDLYYENCKSKNFKIETKKVKWI